MKMKNKSKRKMKKISFLSPKFPSYLTSHTKPENLRKYIAGKKRIARMDISPFNAWGKPKVIPKKDMTWPQAKIRFPKLKPMVDTDRDGVINLLDCRPFYKKRQGIFHKGQRVLDDLSIGFEDIKKLKTVGDVQRLEESILNKEEDKD